MAFGQDAPAAAVVTIGDWGRQIFSVGNVTDKEASTNGYYAGVGTSWGQTPRIVGLNITAHTDTVGFSITPQADDGTFGLTDQNKAWVNPLPGLTIESGINLHTDTWRGTADYGSWDWLRFQGTQGDSFTFTRLGEDGGTQTDINYNKDGIGVWALWQQGTGSGQSVNQSLATNVQAGAAYAIPSVGTIKAQYIGSNVSGFGGALTTANSIKKTYTTSGVVNAAFNLSAVPNLYEEIGVYVPTSTDAGYTVQVTNYATYTIDKAALHLLVGVIQYNDANGGDNALGLSGGLGADYDLGDSIGVSGDVRYTNAKLLNGGTKVNAANTDNGMTGFFAGIKKGFSNGNIGIGFEYTTIAFGGEVPSSVDNSVGHWSIPVRLEESF
jgi:hypothetical protein